jgi:hypothetical protein
MMWTSTSPLAASWVNRFTDRASALQLLPAAALAGTDDDLGDLVMPCERQQGFDDVVARQLVPARANLGDQAAQFVKLPIARSTSDLAVNDVDDVQVGLESRGHPRSPTNEDVGAGRCGHTDHDALSRLPRHLRVMAL